MVTTDSPGCYCQTHGLDCRQGRACPLREDTEASNVIPLHPERPFPAPKGKKPMDYQYRSTSSAWTGRAPRTVEERWPSAPVSAPAGWFSQLLTRLFGR